MRTLCMHNLGRPCKFVHLLLNARVPVERNDPWIQSIVLSPTCILLYVWVNLKEPRRGTS